jgi:hypothetical protein
MHAVERYQLTDSPYFYHGTRADYLPSILKWGLLPNLYSCYIDELVPMAGYTYLSANLETAEIYAGATINLKDGGNEFLDHPEVQDMLQTRYFGGIVLRIDSRYLSAESFCADEDSLVFRDIAGQKAWQHFGLTEPGKCHGAWGKGKLHEPRLVGYSLGIDGCLAYRGHIPPASLRLHKSVKSPPYSFRSSFAFIGKYSY